MSERQLARLIAALIIAGLIAMLSALGQWLDAPYRQCVELHSVDTCHSIFNP